MLYPVRGVGAQGDPPHEHDHGTSQSGADELGCLQGVAARDLQQAPRGSQGERSDLQQGVLRIHVQPGP